jgi:hypothetical protein
MCKLYIYLYKNKILIIIFSENPSFFTERWTLLRSKFAKKKYWREYEIRTYYKKFHVNSFFFIVFF